MADKYIRLGSSVDIFGYDSADYTESMEIPDPIKCLGTPSDPDHLAKVSTTTYLPFTSTAVSLLLTTSHTLVSVTNPTAVITLPSAVGISGKWYSIDNSSTGNVSVLPNGVETIESETSQLVLPDSAMNIYSNGANWRFF